MKVSVIIPVYNVEAYLPACLDSVLGQTLRDIEVICVDDCSPDGSGRILDEYARRDARVHVLHLPENRRQGYARNRGLEIARGEYAYFLDSDDEILSGTLEELCAAADAERLDVVYFDSRAVYESEDLRKDGASYIETRKGVYPDTVVSGQELFELFWRQNEWLCYVQRQLLRTDLLLRENVRFPEGVEHEDELFSFEAILVAKRARYLRRAYFLRRYRPDSVMTRPPSPRNFHGYFMNFVLMDRFLREKGIEDWAANMCLMHMHERFSNFYGKMSGREDIASWFRPEEMDLFHFYAACRRVQGYYRPLRQGLEEILRQYRHLWIYGAGVVAERAWRALAETGFAVEGFVVTKREGNPETLFGHRVVPLAELDGDRESTLLILSMTRPVCAQVAPGLEAQGWRTAQFLD